MCLCPSRIILHGEISYAKPERAPQDLLQAVAKIAGVEARRTVSDIPEHQGTAADPSSVQPRDDPKEKGGPDSEELGRSAAQHVQRLYWRSI